MRFHRPCDTLYENTVHSLSHARIPLPQRRLSGAATDALTNDLYLSPSIK